MLLPEYKPVRYARSPLKLVVSQVRFPILLRFLEPGFVADFQEAMASSYPQVGREQQVTFQLSPEGMGPGPTETLFRFSDRSSGWAVILGEASLTLEARAYSDVDELVKRFEQMTLVASETLGVRRRTRLGLRYVNEFRLPEATTLAAWKDYFRPEFLGFAGALFGESVNRMAQDVQLTRPDGRLAIRHGLLQGTTVVPPRLTEGLPTEPFYLLDLDYSDEREVELEVPATLKQLREFNVFIYRFFRWTLSERLHSTLEPLHERPA
jgi:uncharacterized protein (TIGR04255 family)